MIILILFIGFIFRLILVNRGTLWFDLNSWIGWSNRILDVGFKNFYQSWCDYLPGYLYVLWLLGNFKSFFLSLKIDVPNQLLYKMPSILGDLGTAYLLFQIIKKFKNRKIALIASFIYLFNPAIWSNSTLWGQADSFFTFFLLLSLYLLGKNLLLSSLSLSFASFTKPQGLFFLPLISLYLLKNLKQKKLLKIIIYYLLFLAFGMLLFFPFLQGNIFTFIKQRFEITLNQYSYTALNAFNFWYLLGENWQKDSLKFLTITYKQWGLFIFALFYFLTLLFLKKTTKKTPHENLINAFSLIAFSSFLFLTRMHERHLFPTLTFLNLAASFNPYLWLNYLVASLIYVLNLRYAFIWLSQDFKAIFSLFTIQIVSALQLINFILLLIFLWKKSLQFKCKLSFSQVSSFFYSHKFFGKKTRQKKPKTKKKIKKGKQTILNQQGKLYLALILFFSFFIRILNLAHPQTHIFDEVYHAFTAQEMYKGNVAAWEWWHTPPKGFAYEWTHPPMAKLLMIGGISIFGSNSFGWRFPAAIFGTGVVFLIYLLGKTLFNKRVGLISAFLSSFEGLIFVMSRIGMSDIYFLFFTLAAILAKLKKKTFLSAIFFGFALATKWTALYLLPLILLLNFLKKKFSWTLLSKIAFEFCFYLLMATFIYLLSYWPFLKTHSFGKFIDLQKQMWWYHIHLRATHTYQSRAFTWPLMLRPVWFYVKYGEEKIANIYALGNPLIFWGGLLVLPYALIKAFLKKQKNLAFLLLAYFSFWVPWILSPRIMFLYHYLPSIPFLCLMLAWQLERWFKKGGERKFWVKVYLILVILTFFFFYPHLTGILVPKTLNKFYYWLPTWK